VDINPQFLQICILGAGSVMMISGGRLYSPPRRCKPTVL
jgi:hypothetical protein